MSRIGSLASSAAQTFDLNYLPQFIQVASPEDTNVISALTVNAKGRTLIQLSDRDQISCLMKLENEPYVYSSLTTGAANIPSRLWLAEGRIETSSIITATNSQATTPAVYANSLGKAANNIARTVAVQTVNASANLTIRNFDVLFFLPTNVDRANVKFENGWSEEMTTQELAGLYGANDVTNANCLVEGFVVVQGSRAPKGWKVKEITIYATSGGAVNVVVAGFTTL